MANTDELLALRLKKGDRRAADVLVERYHEQIYLFLRRLGHSCEMSDELTQQTFVQAWSRIGQLTNGRSLGGWLYRIAGNASTNEFRKAQRRRQVDIDQVQLPSDEMGGMEKLELGDELAQVKRAVDRLPEKLRQAVVLHYMQHLSIAEAATAASVRKGTFKSRLSRALKSLRDELTST